jgi:hypothetical protein
VHVAQTQSAAPTSTDALLQVRESSEFIGSRNFFPRHLWAPLRTAVPAATKACLCPRPRAPLFAVTVVARALAAPLTRAHSPLRRALTLHLPMI